VFLLLLFGRLAVNNGEPIDIPPPLATLPDRFMFSVGYHKNTCRINPKNIRDTCQGKRLRDPPPNTVKLDLKLG